MHKIAVAENLYTPGNELMRLDGRPYMGYYHIQINGAYFTGNIFQSGSSEELIPRTFLPQNQNGDLVSMYDENTDSFEGSYSVVTIKNYKNDIDIAREVVEQEALEFPPVTITDQPDIFFKKNTTKNYIPGRELFVDENRNIQVRKGLSVELQFGYESADDPDNIKFEWVDSFDRVVSNEPNLLIDTNEIDGDSDTFSCTITDSYGSDTTNEITITIINPEDHPIIFKNILKNGSANQSTGEWETVGDNPEEVGKFLNAFEISKDTNGLQVLGYNTVNAGLGSGDWGSIFYHKFSSSILQPNTFNKNQWYPVPQFFDDENNFAGSVVNEIKENYFRGGTMEPVLPNQNSHSGTSKSSFQIIDLTEHTDLIDGKVYGIEGFRVNLFGWLGGRADQGDSCYCELEFFDEDDHEIITDETPVTIASLEVYDRIINEVRGNAPVTTFQVGIIDTRGNVSIPTIYRGIFYDGNDAIELPQVQATAIANLTGTGANSTYIQQVTEAVNALCKTIIIGRSSDMILVPIGTRKIKVTKFYIHAPGKYDLIFAGQAWDDLGLDYKSEAMVVGLNVRMYPRLVDLDNQIIDTGLDDNGDSIITGMNMDLLPVTSSAQFVDDFDLHIQNVQWLNQNTFNFGIQLFDTRDSDWAPVTVDGEDNERPVHQLGPNVTATMNNHFKSLVSDVLRGPSNDLHKAFELYGTRPQGPGMDGHLYSNIYDGMNHLISTGISLYAASRLNNNIFKYNNSSGQSFGFGDVLTSDNGLL